MATYVGMHEAKTHLSRLVERARDGEEIVIRRSGKPVAKLVPIEEERKRTPYDSIGIWRGKVWIADDFDEFGEDLQRMFGFVD